MHTKLLAFASLVVCCGCSSDLSRQQALQLLRADTTLNRDIPVSVSISPEDCELTDRYALSFGGNGEAFVPPNLRNPNEKLLEAMHEAAVIKRKHVAFPRQVAETGLLRDDLPLLCRIALQQNLRETLSAEIGRKMLVLSKDTITDKGTDIGVQYGYFQAVVAKQRIAEVTGILADGDNSRVIEFVAVLEPTDIGSKSGLFKALGESKLAGRRTARLYDDGWRLEAPAQQ